MSRDHEIQEEWDARVGLEGGGNDVSSEIREQAELEAGQVLEVAQQVATVRRDIEKVQAGLARSRKVAEWADEFKVVKKIPFLKHIPWLDKIAPEAVIGMVTGLGDAAGAVPGLYIVAEALNAGVPPWKIFKMLVNIGIDFALGSVPVAGDVFDFVWKSNKRNVRIFESYLSELQALEHGSQSS